MSEDALDEYKDLMTLLAMTVLVDNRVSESEVDIFKKSVSRIKLSKLDVALPSETQAVDWFIQKRVYLKSIANKPRADFDIWLEILLKRIEKHVKGEALLHVMEMIAIADGEKHEGEAYLIERVQG